VSLSGKACSSLILGCLVFDLTFFNEVSRLHVTIRNIQAQVIDSCIPVIVSRPIIRANHLVHKIPLYFDEGPSFKPDRSQPVEPVTTLSTTKARCRGTKSCGTRAPIVVFFILLLVLLAVDEIKEFKRFYLLNEYSSLETELRKKLWNMFIRLCYWIVIIFDVYWCTYLLTL
jgi:hypothetical protein